MAVSISEDVCYCYEVGQQMWHPRTSTSTHLQARDVDPDILPPAHGQYWNTDKIMNAARTASHPSLSSTSRPSEPRIDAPLHAPRSSCGLSNGSRTCSRRLLLLQSHALALVPDARRSALQPGVAFLPCLFDRSRDQSLKGRERPLSSTASVIPYKSERLNVWREGAYFAGCVPVAQSACSPAARHSDPYGGSSKH